MKVETKSFGEVELVNLLDLSYQGKMQVLAMRNHPSVREQMYNEDIISEYNHLKFIDGLKDSNKQYFMVCYQEKIIGVINFTEILPEECSAVFGIYANMHEKVPGIGSILMEAALSFFDNVLLFSTLTLEVFKSNERAFKLYENFGFLVENYSTRDNREAIIMKRVKNFP